MNLNMRIELNKMVYLNWWLYQLRMSQQVLQVGWQKQQKLISHSSRDWKVPREDASKVRLILRPPLAGCHHPTVFTRPLIYTRERNRNRAYPSLLVSLLIGTLLLSYQSLPTITTSFNSNYFFKSEIKIQSHWGLRPSIYDLGAVTIYTPKE